MWDAGQVQSICKERDNKEFSMTCDCFEKMWSRDGHHPRCPVFKQKSNVMTYLTKHQDIGSAVCLECHTVLSFSIINGIEGYLHFALPYDTHFPIVSPQLESTSTIFICDFCSDRHQQDDLGTVLTKPIIRNLTIGPTELSPDWAACQTCIDLISQDEWVVLALRSSRCADYKDMSQADALDFIVPLYAEIRKNLISIEPPKNKGSDQ